MPTPTAWDELDLCSRADIDRAIGSRPLALAGSVDSGRYDQIVVDAIGQAKLDIEERIRTEAPSRFRTGATVAGTATTLTVLDGLVDIILNPEVLLRCAVALACAEIFQRALDMSTAIYPDRPADDAERAVKLWTGRAEKRWTTAFALLQFDLDDSGDASDGERVSEHGTVWRR